VPDYSAKSTPLDDDAPPVGEELSLGADATPLPDAVGEPDGLAVSVGDEVGLPVSVGDEVGLLVSVGVGEPVVGVGVGDVAPLDGVADGPVEPDPDTLGVGCVLDATHVGADAVVE
jgi:hypothetical protein